MNRHSDEGFTLVELMVTLMLMTLVSVVILNFLVSATSVTARATNDAISESDARLALRVMTEDIRAAQARIPATLTFTSGTACASSTVKSPATCLQFKVMRDTVADPNCVSLMTYGLVGTEVKASRTDTDCARTLNYSGKTVINKVVNGADPLFTYFDAAGKQVAPSALTAVPPAPAPPLVASVRVDLALSYQKNSPTLRVSSFASLRNSR